MRTTLATKETVERRWLLVDAAEKTPGRLAARIARILMGKHTPRYTPHVDTGDHVVVVNAGRMRLTGRKSRDKAYYRYTGYPGGLRTRLAGDLMVSDPGEVLRLAVRRMLPKTKMGKQMLTKLRVYPAAEHPHEAQNPEPVTL